MSTRIVDGFTRANGGLGANWTTVTGADAPAIVSNLVRASSASGVGSTARYTATALPNDQFVQIRIVTCNTNDERKLVVFLRSDSDLANFYGFFINGPLGGAGSAGLATTFVTVDTVYTELGSTSVATATNDVMYLEALGTQITSKIGGVTVHSVSDPGVASGSAGLQVFAAVGVALSDVELDDFAAGDFLGTALHDTASESHTGTTGSASEASFTWDHTPMGLAKGVLCFTFVNANADNATAVTYGGASLTAVTGGRALATSTEAGDCKAWFLGSSVPTTAPAAVVVTRTNNANVMYATCITVTGPCNTEVKGAPVLLEGSAVAAFTEQAVDAGAGVYAVRYAGANSGLGGVVDDTTPAAGLLSHGANSTELHSIDFSARVIMTVRETTPGTGSRSVGFVSGSDDDRAGVHLAIGDVVVAGSIVPHVQMQYRARRVA